MEFILPKTFPLNNTEHHYGNILPRIFRQPLQMSYQNNQTLFDNLLRIIVNYIKKI